jgi:BMFP domain-containing protein YqiC
MARLAREENEALKARVAALEARLGVSAAAAEAATASRADVPHAASAVSPPPTGYFA